MSDLTVVKDNQLIEASYKLTLAEQRLILCYVSKLNSTGSLSKKDEFDVHVQDYAKLYGLNGKNAYSQVKEIADTLYERSIVLRSKKGQRYIKTRWVSSVEYAEKEGLIRLGFAPKIIPYLSKLESCFTEYKLKHIVKMTSAYAIRLYEMLIQWKIKGKLELEIKQLRSHLGILDNEYPRMYDFKKRVLDVALKQINAHSDINVKLGQKKKGKRVTHLVFKFGYKENLKRKISEQKQQKLITELVNRLEDGQTTLTLLQ